VEHQVTSKSLESKANNKEMTHARLSDPSNSQISWFCEKRNCVSQHTTEAEYTTTGRSCSKLVHKKGIMKVYNVEQDVPILRRVKLSIINTLKSTIQYSIINHLRPLP